MRMSAPLLTSLALIPIAACAGPMGPPLGLGPGWDELVWVAIVELIVALAYGPVRKLMSTRRQTTNAALPMAILRERYARGKTE